MEPARYQLGGYREFPVSRDLRPFAPCVWLHRTPRTLSLPANERHRVLPEPEVSLAFTCWRDDAGGPVEPRLILVGPVRRTRWFGIEPGFEMVAVKLKREWTAPLLGLEPGDHGDALEDLTGLVPRFATPLLERLTAAVTTERAGALLVGAVRGAAARRGSGHSLLARRALEMVRRSGGRVRLDRLASQLGVSARHLRRSVRDAGGIGLKTYARQVRFLTAVYATDRTPRPSWARVAFEVGCFDQAHLGREFRRFAGLTPQQLHRERRAESEISYPD